MTQVLKYRNAISEALKKLHSHASHKARGHCSISLLHVVASLIMGGRFTVYLPGFVTSLWHYWDRFPSMDTFG